MRNKYCIIYWSKYGSTKEVAHSIYEKIKDHSDLYVVDDVTPDILKEYQYIIIGSPVYIFKLASNIMKFMQKNKQVLLTKKIILFILCTMNREQLGEEWIKRFFTNEFLDNIIYYEYMGGRRCYDKVSDFDKSMLDGGKKYYGDRIITDDFDSLSEDKVENFINKLNGITG